MFNIPTEGSAIPEALATATPYIAFFTIPSMRSVELVPVVEATNMGFPLAGVITLPIVVTPRGKG